MIKLKKVSRGWYELRLKDGSYFFVENGSRAELDRKSDWFVSFYGTHGICEFTQTVSSLKEAREVIKASLP